ncbi:MAG: hypothetical protein AAF466_03980 [Bacteroidota bacterium]
MEKSIERIWKEGFLKQDAMVAPKVNDLYNQKSDHIIDKIIRMGKINLYAIAIGSLVVLTIALMVGSYMGGTLLFLVLNSLVWAAVQNSKGLQRIDKGGSSYEYINSFNNWLQSYIRKFRRIYRVVYPLIFFAFLLGFWEYGGADITRELLESNPDMTFILGVPKLVFIIGLLIVGLAALFSGPLYRFDVWSVYGPVLRKLKEILTDMEELRS